MLPRFRAPESPLLMNTSRARRPALPQAKSWATGLLLLAIAVVLRLLFWKATPDQDWYYTTYFKGDAAFWMSWAQVLKAGQVHDLGLPYRAPGMAYVVQSLWDGRQQGIPTLRFLWCLLGAALVLPLYPALARSFGSRVAAITGALCAGSTGLMVFSTSLNNEGLYLLLVVLSLWLFESLRHQRNLLLAAAWAALHALACLTRVENLLFFAPSLLLLAWIWRSRHGLRAATAGVALCLATFALFLVPWHVQSWTSLYEYNTTERLLSEESADYVRRLEPTVARMTWSPEASERAAKMPAFARRVAATFVAATAQQRGRSSVEAADLDVLEEAFGYEPRPLGSFPFVAMTGGLNFALANTDSADGGFARELLNQPPPMAGRPGDFAPFFGDELPPAYLSLDYPPHLQLFNEGYALGGRWMREHPAACIALMRAKLERFWAGATLGLTGFGLPLGSSGVRRNADLVVPEGGPLVTLWRSLVLALCVAGVVLCRNRVALLPWLLFLGSRVLATTLFYGYARHGALVLPVVFLLVALTADRVLPRAAKRSRGRWIGPLLLGLLVVIEAGRTLGGVQVSIDGQIVQQVDPFPPIVFQERTLEYTWPAP